MRKTSAAKNEKREIDLKVIDLWKKGFTATEIAEMIGMSYTYVRDVINWYEAGGPSIAAADFHNKPQAPALTEDEEALVREEYEKRVVRHPAGNRTLLAFPSLSELNKHLAGKVRGVTRKNPRYLMRILIHLHLGFEHKHTRIDPIYRGTWFELNIRDTAERIIIFAAVNAPAGRLVWFISHAAPEKGYIAFLRHLDELTASSRPIHLSMNLPERFMRSKAVLRELGTMGPKRFEFDMKDWPEAMESFTVKVTLPHLQEIARLARMSGENPADALQQALERIAISFLADRIGRQENCRTSHSVQV